jgi:hypothetical protein
MGLVWDLIQQSQLSGHEERATSLEERGEQLERELRTQSALHDALMILEKRLGEDLDADQRVGR